MSFANGQKDSCTGEERVWKCESGGGREFSWFPPSRDGKRYAHFSIPLALKLSFLTHPRRGRGGDKELSRVGFFESRK
ncbi:hypothetical protein CK510_01480 [Brunnivagina elsteri CCALA 953]|uniref:Uncharacterized protein n=1 Tax=Brunnivagina elsteri CCALA 953 TaxID=987040 RepID=A0A2A2TPW1_9CYAN|nr:hypothetical protein CK510_01480 [Calothrix elsteri CCALA 953]